MHDKTIPGTHKVCPRCGGCLTCDGCWCGPPGKKRKPKKPYTVEWRAIEGQLFRDWSVYSRYKTEKDRDKGLRALSCSGHPMFEFRAGNPRPHLTEAQPPT